MLLTLVAPHKVQLNLSLLCFTEHRVRQVAGKRKAGVSPAFSFLC